jgi:nucleotide-binding universal stress UspA family protein
MGTIVVGVDGSAGSEVALRWALAEARIRGAGVRIVHAYQRPLLPLADAGLGPAGGAAVAAVLPESVERLRSAAERQARGLIDEELQRVNGGATHGLDIERTAVEGPTAQVLIESARGADLLVIGSRGRGGFLGLLLGSVSHQCAHHPPCPVVILPPPEEPASGE